MERIENKTDKISLLNEIDKTNMSEKEVYYKAIMCAEDFNKAENLFYEYMEKYTKMRDVKSIFKAILMRVDSYGKAKELLSYMYRYGFKADIKMYNILLKNIDNKDEVIKLYNKMKALCIIMDSEFLKKVADKVIGTDKYYQIQYERDCFKQIQETAEKIETSQELIDSIENIFYKNEIDETAYNYFIFINSLKEANIVKKCIEILYIRKIKPNEKIYMAVLNKLIKNNKDCIVYLEILDNLKKQLHDEEKRKLIDILNYYSKGNGGETKWLFEKDKLSKECEKKILLEDNIEKQQFLMGKVEALNIETYDKYKNLRINLNEVIMETKAEDDFELYRLEISNLLGQLSGVQKAEELYNSIKQKNIPILYIVYIESREFLYQVENQYLTDYYYYLKKIGNKKVNSFIIADTVEKFIQYLNEIDYNIFDVRVKIYGDSAECRDFYSKSNENKKIYDYMYFNMQKKICFLTYDCTKFRDKDKNKIAVSIIRKDKIIIPEKNILVDNYYSIKYIETLKNRIDVLNIDELIDFQKMGNYYIPILRGMLNRCITKKQKDWQFIFTILAYERKIDIEKDVENISAIEEISGAIRIDIGKFEEIRTMIKKHIDILSETVFFERLKEAQEILAEIILIRSGNNILNKSLAKNIAKAEVYRKNKADLNKIPFERLKNRFAYDTEFIKLISDIQMQ